MNTEALIPIDGHHAVIRKVEYEGENIPRTLEEVWPFVALVEVSFIRQRSYDPITFPKNLPNLFPVVYFPIPWDRHGGPGQEKNAHEGVSVLAIHPREKARIFRILDSLGYPFTEVFLTERYDPPPDDLYYWNLDIVVPVPNERPLQSIYKDANNIVSQVTFCTPEDRYSPPCVGF